MNGPAPGSNDSLRPCNGTICRTIITLSQLTILNGTKTIYNHIHIEYYNELNKIQITESFHNNMNLDMDPYINIFVIFYIFVFHSSLSICNIFVLIVTVSGAVKRMLFNGSLTRKFRSVLFLNFNVSPVFLLSLSLC